jgi:hypothetical protein
VINGGLNVGDLVRVLATEDIMRYDPDYAHCTGTVIEIRPNEFYTNTQRPDGGPWQVARIFVPGVGKRYGGSPTKEWSLKVWGEDLVLLQEDE